jgi:hypothetical protein
MWEMVRKLTCLFITNTKIPVFFIDQAPDPDKHPCEFKIGNKRYWKEANCKYEKQLEWAENLKDIPREPEEIQRRAKLQWAKDAAEHEEEFEEEDSEKIETNTDIFAEPQQRMDRMIERQKQLGIGESILSKRRKGLFTKLRYIPGYNGDIYNFKGRSH